MTQSKGFGAPPGDRIGPTRARTISWDVMALRKWAGYMALHPVTVCIEHQSLQSWHKEHVDTPSCPASRRARWHETLAKYDLTIVYVPGKDNSVADCLSR